MSRVLTISLTAILAVALVACGSDEKSQMAGGDIGDFTASSASASEAGVDPCEILDEGLIRDQFSLGQVELTYRPSEYSPHPLCTVIGDKPNAAEIEAKSGEAMMEYMKAKMAGKKVDMPDFRTTNQVSLTVNKREFDSPEQAVSAFDSAMRVMTEGVTGGTEDGPKVTFQADAEPVQGVGQKAAWAPKLRQLSVAGSTRVIHVTVNLDGDLAVERDKAKQVAQAILPKL